MATSVMVAPGVSTLAPAVGGAVLISSVNRAQLIAPKTNAAVITTTTVTPPAAAAVVGSAVVGTSIVG